LKKQSQFIRSEFSVPRAARTKLKKQSQFTVGADWRKALFERKLRQQTAL
jgi:hypothetical protein